ncbi:MAG: hypothetical protein PHN75_03335, partial [Syntrophales bacterium]|nr:hypothetical protein [Syntrophales bacterium]
MVIPDDLKRWMEIQGFRFQRLVIDGIDNQPVLAVNKPEMAGEEICLFHRNIASGDEYLERLQTRLEQSLKEGRPLPIVRFADGEYAFYKESLECNGLYRQAESADHIGRALPIHVQALHTLMAAGMAAPLVFPGNIARKTTGFFSFIGCGKEKPSASTFLAFLEQHAIELTDDSYVPFYTIYAWLTSARFAKSINRRHVCIINADWSEKAVRCWFEAFSSHPDLVFVDLPAEYVATQWPSQREAVLAKIPSDTDLCL